LFILFHVFLFIHLHSCNYRWIIFLTQKKDLYACLCMCVKNLNSFDSLGCCFSGTRLYIYMWVSWKFSFNNVVNSNPMFLKYLYVNRVSMIWLKLPQDYLFQTFHWLLQWLVLYVNCVYDFFEGNMFKVWNLKFEIFSQEYVIFNIAWIHLKFEKVLPFPYSEKNWTWKWQIGFLCTFVWYLTLMSFECFDRINLLLSFKVSQEWKATTNLEKLLNFIFVHLHIWIENALHKIMLVYINIYKS
jgi:hypothetical protein